ncbi:MAG: PEGA domain-containing protein [Fimbriimonadaceae bacterium]|nr:PEGA domain-containing protein [Fimbriimonadaceae bacterium]
MNWDSFRVDSASLYLREEAPGTCTAELKMAFAGFGKPMFGRYSWYAVDSSFNLEKAILDDLEGEAGKAASGDLDKAISQLPTEAPKPANSQGKPQLTITSEPTGAEIEINGEYIGSTPTTATVNDGALVITIKKPGFQPWQRTVKVAGGDKRTVHGDLLK